MDGVDSWNAGGQASLIYIVCGYIILHANYFKFLN